MRSPATMSTRSFHGDRHAIERARRASLPMTDAARHRFLKRALTGDENERWILAVALEEIATQKEFRSLDRVEGRLSR